MKSYESDSDCEEMSEGSSGRIFFAKEMVQLYAALVFFAFIVWLIRWPFYGDEFYHFMQTSILFVTIMFSAVVLWMLAFFLFCRFPTLGIVFIVLCIIASLSNDRKDRFEECIENKLTSTCN
jgi:hypothetical protein